MTPPNSKFAPSAQSAIQPLSDAEMQRLEALLDALPDTLQPLDISALDGFLCGVLLQPQRVSPAAWLPLVTDLDAQPAPAGEALQELHALVRRRHQELDRAIGERQWFDPWIYQLDDADDDSDPDDAAAGEEDGEDDGGLASPTECVLPWVAGFAAAMEHFPALMDMPAQALVEPLALLFMHFDPEDLEDADELLAVIETLEPPSDLGEAVQDTVRALMLIADVTRPRITAPPKNRPKGPPPRRGGGGYRR